MMRSWSLDVSFILRSLHITDENYARGEFARMSLIKRQGEFNEVPGWCGSQTRLRYGPEETVTNQVIRVTHARSASARWITDSLEYGRY